MSKFQKGDRVRHDDGEVVLVSNVGEKFFTMLRPDGTAYETQIVGPCTWRHVTESLRGLPPVMGERLIMNSYHDVTYMGEDSVSKHRLVQTKEGFVRSERLSNLSRPKRTRTASKVVYYNAKLALAVGNPYVVQGADEPYPNGWVRVCEFSHEVAA